MSYTQKEKAEKVDIAKKQFIAALEECDCDKYIIDVMMEPDPTEDVPLASAPAVRADNMIESLGMVIDLFTVIVRELPIEMQKMVALMVMQCIDKAIDRADGAEKKAFDFVNSEEMDGEKLYQIMKDAIKDHDKVD